MSVSKVVLDLLAAAPPDTEKRLDAIPETQATLSEILDEFDDVCSSKMCARATSRTSILVRDWLARLFLKHISAVAQNQNGLVGIVADSILQLFELWTRTPGGIVWCVNEVIWPWLREFPRATEERLRAEMAIEPIIDALMDRWMSTLMDQAMDSGYPDLYRHSDVYVEYTLPNLADIFSVFLDVDKFRLWSEEEEQEIIVGNATLIFAQSLQSQHLVQWKNIAEKYILLRMRESPDLDDSVLTTILTHIPLEISLALVKIHHGHQWLGDLVIVMATSSSLNAKNAMAILDFIEADNPEQMDYIAAIVCPWFLSSSSKTPPRIPFVTSMVYANEEANVPWFHLARAASRQIKLSGKLGRITQPIAQLNMVAERCAWMHWIQTNKQTQDKNWSPKPYQGCDLVVATADAVLREIFPSAICSLILSNLAGVDGDEGPPRELFGIMDNIRVVVCGNVHSRQEEKDQGNKRTRLSYSLV